MRVRLWAKVLGRTAWKFSSKDIYGSVFIVLQIHSLFFKWKNSQLLAGPKGTKNKDYIS